MEAPIGRKSANILSTIVGVALVSLVVVLIVSRSPTTPPFTANKGQLIRELRDRKFQTLDTQPNSCQKGFEENVSEEGNLSIAFETFTITDPAFHALLDDWVKGDPKSYPAHLARAKYLIALAWQARGGEYADKTSAQQFSEMTRLMGEAVKDALSAIKLKPKSSLAYASIIEAASAVSDNDVMEKVCAAGLKSVPLSLSIRGSMIYALRPRWGGSYEAMAMFAANAQKYARQNPRLVRLKGYADEDKANSDRRAEELATDGDQAGAAIWRRVTVAIEQLTDTTGPPH